MDETLMRACVKQYQEDFASYQVYVPERGLLEPGTWKPGRNFQVYGEDNRHYPMGNACLKLGIPGILEKTQPRAEDTEETAAYRKMVHQVYQCLLEYILRHRDRALELQAASTGESREHLALIADNCGQLARGKPRTFLQGLQLFWFLYLVRSPFGGGCIGRLDQKLLPFYEQETAAGTWDRDLALEAVMEFYRCLNHMSTGDTLRNLMLSGQDAQGNDETNPLTYLFLEAYEKTGDAEPHLNVRLHPGSPQELRRACVQMMAQGKGQPTLYFDQWILPAMEKAGIAHEDACCYANDGCTETVIDGRSHIAFWQMELVKTVELTMFNGQENPSITPVEMTKNRRGARTIVPKTSLTLGYSSGELEQMHTFQDFLDAFSRQLHFQLEKKLEQIGEKIRQDETTTMTSPLIAGTFEECVETGKDPLRGGGFSVFDYQLLSGTVTTAADCLRGVEYCVFEKKDCTLEQLRDAMAADFAGQEPLRQRLLHAPKYGNGEKRVDQLAAWISQEFLDQVNDYRTESGKRVWPGLYNIDFKIFANITGATPDGRKFRDAIGEHCSPTPGAAKKGPTAVVESASKLPMSEGYASSPLHLTLNKSDFVMGAEREAIVETLMHACEQAGVPVLNISMYDADQLRQAQKHPEQYRDLIVRVWGFNARFVELDEELQNHIINRIT
ncbi:MAG: pyruvate formate lyase family protein [Acutalibacter sp.]|jgi:pyruvate-formate lyase